MLEVIRKIEPKYYNYVDKLSRHEYRTIGFFIAQQVKEYYPEAVRLVKKCIPDVMKSLTNVIWTEVNEEDTIKYKLSSNLTNVNGIKYRFYVSDDYNTNEEDLLVEGNSDNTFTFDKKWDRIFCYGKQVDDFHTLEKEKIFTLYHSAIQETDKQQTQDKQTINNLQSEVVKN